MVVTHELKLETRGHSQVIDLTDQVAGLVSQSGLKAGLVCLFVPGSTASLTTMEYESGLVEDVQAALQRLVPEGIPYHHDRRWGDGNGYAHVRAALLGPSLTVPIVEGQMALVTWQQIVLIDFDNRPRSRKVVAQIVGEPG